MNEQHDPLKDLITSLRPDAYTEDAYMRRRSADLTRAMRPSRRTQHSRRFFMSRPRPLLVMAGTAAVAGLAAAVIVVPQVFSDRPATGGSAAGGSIAAPDTVASPRKGSGSAAAAPKTANARAVLLDVAKVAAKEPLEEGRFWYQRVRTSALVHSSEEVYYRKLKVLDKEYRRTENDPNATAAEKEAAKERFTQKLIKLKQETLPYFASFASTSEKWLSLTGGKGREVYNQKPKITFATPEDEAKWRQDGSPALRFDANEGPKKEEGKPNYLLSIGNPGLTWSNIRDLPTDKRGLKAKLKEVYQGSSAKEQGDSLAQFYWEVSFDLLIAPITPGTRAALYEVLADSASGLKSQTGVTDSLGRTGVALEVPGDKDDSDRGGKVTKRMIFDAESGKILQIDILEEGLPFPTLEETFQVTGYVDKLGEVPQS